MPRGLISNKAMENQDLFTVDSIPPVGIPPMENLSVRSRSPTLAIRQIQISIAAIAPAPPAPLSKPQVLPKRVNTR